MVVSHMAVPQFRGPITYCVLQWCHPMLTGTQRRTSCSTRMITLYGDHVIKLDSGPRTNSFIFMQFSAKIVQNNRLVHPSWELTSPPHPLPGNPGFAIAKYLEYFTCKKNSHFFASSLMLVSSNRFPFAIGEYPITVIPSCRQ